MEREFSFTEDDIAAFAQAMGIGDDDPDALTIDQLWELVCPDAPSWDAVASRARRQASAGKLVPAGKKGKVFRDGKWRVAYKLPEGER